MVSKDASLKLLDTYIRIPTISNTITSEMTEKVLDFWRQQGLSFELLWPEHPVSSKISNPVLFSEVKADVSGAPTLLLYGHWDVQPVGDLANWRWQDRPAPPFEPTYFLDDQFVGSTTEEVLAKTAPSDLERVLLVARGSADNKGQHLANILGVLKAKAAGKLEWNVKIILDGEEEVGSPNLGAIIQTHREKLAAEFMVGSDGPKSDNLPTILLGVRGLLALILRCQNNSGRMLHSGNYGNVVPNPVLTLSRLLDRMSSEVKTMGQERGEFRQKINSYFEQTSPDRAYFEPFLYPTFNINSIISEGATTGQRRTIIPGWVEASIDVRLVPGLPPQEVYERLQNLADEAGKSAEGLTLTLEQRSATAASFTAPDREGFKWLMEGVHRFWGDRVRLIPLLGGTLPNDVFTDGLGMASYWLPAANSNNRQHDTNEHFVLEHFFRQQEFYAALVSEKYTV